MSRPWTHRITGMVCAAASILAVSHFLEAQGTPPPPAPTGRFACIDIVRVFNEFEKQQEFVREIKEAQSTLQAEDKNRREALDKLQAELNKLQLTDPTYKTRAKELTAKTIDYKNWVDVKQATLQREIGVWSAQFYRDIATATEQIAMQQGFDAVFYKDEFEMPQNADPNQVREQIRNRKLIYVNPGIDLSQIVLDKLNVEFRGKKDAKPMLDLN